VRITQRLRQLRHGLAKVLVVKFMLMSGYRRACW